MVDYYILVKDGIVKMAGSCEHNNEHYCHNVIVMPQFERQVPEFARNLLSALPEKKTACYNTLRR